MQQLLQKALSELGLACNNKQQEQLLSYVKLLQKWNKAYNLTAIRDEREIFIKHIFDSLSIAKHIKGNRILDLGTGAGLPGIPLAILFPDKKFVLLDTNGKKTRFLLQVKLWVGLDNVDVIHARAEEYQTNQKFDVITVRAVGKISNFLWAFEKLLKPNGELLLMKGVYPEVEMKHINYELSVYNIQVPFLKAARHLVCLKRDKSEQDHISN
ncbi:MAG: 16S rRNA (guanine(527)-N(7))-methyltransferase RsmG [Gammaproteobacteria bacterium]|nr:16S rRNA (guanine(527)-N(7))-methyltransferase RsmG [Gammaproteobacteria bacterium]